MEMPWVGLQYAVQNVYGSQPQTTLHDRVLLSAERRTPLAQLILSKRTQHGYLSRFAPLATITKRLIHVSDVRVKNNFYE